MPPILKIIFVLLGIAPFLRLIITMAMVTCGMAVFLWVATAFEMMLKSSACLMAAYSSFSFLLISLALARRRTPGEQDKCVHLTLLKHSAVRLMGMAL